ncbi:MAG: c-type cytochrome [Alphaproteobacteria bacterium]|jgi:cytochrome c|nr:c-type cytochrome [Alphaproteobacteria bacterium]
MTRTFALSCTSAFALLLAACGGGSEEPAPAPTAPPAESGNDAQAQPAPESASDGESPQTAQAEAAAEDVADSGPAEAEEENVFAALPAPYNTADFDRGKRTYRLCQSCHLIEEGAGNRVGPNLHGMFDRKVGQVEGFNYSPALMEADFDWTPQQLENWLANPNGFLPGNRMSFAGVRRPEDRKAVIAYIMLESGFGEAE